MFSIKNLSLCNIFSLLIVYVQQLEAAELTYIYITPKYLLILGL